MKAVNPVEIFNGATQLYQEVFGAKDGIELGTEFNGVTYDIFDRYCMNPSCKCNDVFLQFFRNGEAGFNVLMSLKNKKYQIVETFRMSEEQAKKVVKHSLKDSDEAIQLFKKRYEEMKNAGREAIQGIIQLDETRREKQERNGLCPCGSGKKYKKCCGT